MVYVTNFQYNIIVNAQFIMNSENDIKIKIEISKKQRSREKINREFFKNKRVYFYY